MMETYGYELEEEFNAVAHFINQKYGINIKTKEQSVRFYKSFINIYVVGKDMEESFVSVF